MIPDIVLKAIISSKKSVSEILDFCESNNICQDKPKADGGKQIRPLVAKQIFKISGYRVDKDFDYRALFKEMFRILKNNRSDKSDKKDKSSSSLLPKSFDERSIELTNNVIKIDNSDRKYLAATGSLELYAFLLHNGIDLRSSSPTGGNFKLVEVQSRITSTRTTEE
jgi:hypothetical protein